MRLSDDLVELELEKLNQILDKVDTEDEKTLWSKLIQACSDGRRTGLGTLGLADCLAALRLPYGSDTAVDMTETIFRTLKNSAYYESVNLARERGTFPVYDPELESGHPFLESLAPVVLEEMAKYGRRNISILTNAPTGSKAIEAQVSSGIEPVFRLSYKRRKKINHNSDAVPDFVDAQGDRWQTFEVLHHNLLRYRNLTGNTDTPSYFVTSDQLDWKQRIAMQAAIQQHIDHSVSSTINLPRGTTVETVSAIYLEAWKVGLKGVTVYVDGSRDGVLITEAPSADQITQSHAPKRPVELPCEIHRADVGDQQWTFLVGLLGGKPYEVFGGLSDSIEIPEQIREGKIIKQSFKTTNARYDLVLDTNAGEIKFKNLTKLFDNPTEGTLTRTVSMSLRHGVPVQFIVEQLQKDDRNSDMFSFSRVLARILKHHIQDGIKVQKACRECGQQTLTYQEGCVLCTNCGYSKCG
jgi:ribonucleoside-diphosphate reductase alpha chain